MKSMFWNIRKKVRMISGGMARYVGFLLRKSGRGDVPVSVSLLFLGAFVLGILTKLLMSFFLTIGYDDYRLASGGRAISLIELQTKTLKEGGSFAYAPRRGTGPVCSDSK